MRSDPGRMLRGYLDIEVSGRETEKFLNYAMREGVEPRNIRRLEQGRLSMRVALGEIYILRHAAQYAHCRLHIRRRHGLPFMLAFLRRRPVILAGLIIAAGLFAYISSLIFSVEITSPYPLAEADRERLAYLAEEAGVKPGSSRWRIDLQQAEQHILNGFPDIFYAEIFEHGTRLEISVVKRINIPEEEKIKPPGAVVAMADGVIQDVLVRRGTAAVKSGDIVAKGDILIHGCVGQELLAADGIVTATVYSEGYGEWRHDQIAERETGRIAQGIGIVFSGGKGLHLAGAAAPPFEFARPREIAERMLLWRIIPLPVEIIYSEFREFERYNVRYAPEEAAELAHMLAGADAREKAAAVIGEEGIQSLALAVEDIDLGDGISRARAVAAVVAAIGDFAPYPEGVSPEMLLPPEDEVAGL